MPIVRLLIRICAAALILAALLPRGVARHERVLVFAADGIRRDYAQKLIEAGSMPVLAGLFGGGLHGTLLGDHTGAGPLRWARMLSAGDDSEAGYVWQRIAALGHRSIAVAVPGTDYLSSGNLVVLAGADDAGGFIGDNIGVVVNSSDAAVAGLAWPYTSASVEIGEATAELARGQASGWISVDQPAPDRRRGVVRAYMLDDDTAYLTPVYTRSRPLSQWIDVGSALAEHRYLPDQPAWSVLSSSEDEVVYRHVHDLTLTRALSAAELARGDWQMLVYVETVLDTVDHVFIEGRPAIVSAAGIPDSVREAYAEVDRRLGLLTEAAGEGSLVVVLGLEPVDTEGAQAARPTTGDGGVGFYVIAGGGWGSTRPGSLEQVAPTLLYLAGVALSGDSIAPPLEGVVARYWQRHLDRVRIASGDAGLLLPLNSETLRRLGALSPNPRPTGP